MTAARALGASSGRIIKRHLLPNCIGQIVATTCLQIPSAIFTESFMSFLGVGVLAPLTSLGSMCSDALGGISTYPYRFDHSRYHHQHYDPVLQPVWRRPAGRPGSPSEEIREEETINGTERKVRQAAGSQGICGSPSLPPQVRSRPSAASAMTWITTRSWALWASPAPARARRLTPSWACSSPPARSSAVPSTFEGRDVLAFSKKEMACLPGQRGGHRFPRTQ